MLVLTRRLGETIYIGEHVVVTVHDLLPHRVILCLIAPANVAVLYRKTWIAPTILPGGERFYTVSLSCMEGFRVGETTVRVNFNPSKSTAGDAQKRFVRVAISAPKSVVVLREEVYHRHLAAQGKEVPGIPFWTWLRRAIPAVFDRTSA